MKVSKVCYGTKGCWSQNAKNSIGHVYVSNERCGSGDVSFVLINGTSVCMDDFRDFRFGVKYNGSTMIGFLMDVNGDRKPNKFGHDIFAVVFHEDKILPGGYDATKAQIDANCGTYCMQKVVQQGYKLPVIVDKK